MRILLPEIPPLREEEIRIFALSLDAQAHQSNIDQTALTEEEAHRAERFRFIIDKNRFISGRTIARRAIRSLLNSSSNLSFTETRNKKPVLSVDRSIQFNISHSGQWVIVAMTLDDPLGVDVEYQDGCKDINGLGKRVMTEKEFALFTAAPDSDRLDLFYSLWVRKEAVLKCMGTGFSLDPRSIEVGHNKASPSIFKSEGEKIQIVELQAHLPLQQYKSALAYKNKEATKTVEVQYCTLLDSR